MAKHLQTGQLGERLAVQLLESKGYQILETNWRFSRAEVDIIAKEGEILVFVEVKTRSTAYFGQPEEFVTPQKERLLADAAAVYMKDIQHTWEFRFDIIAILLLDPSHPQITHFQDAFFPGI